VAAYPELTEARAERIVREAVHAAFAVNPAAYTR
jgi:hypothetical protein